MPEYPKRLVSPEGGQAFVNDADDERTLTAMGYHPEEEKQGEKPKRGRPKKED